MNTTTKTALSRLSRISSAGILIAFSGSALALAADAPSRAPASPSGAAKTTEQASVRKADKPVAQEMTRERIEDDLRRGKYTNVANMLRVTHPQLKDVGDDVLLRIVAERARELLQNGELSGDFGGGLDRPGSNEGSGQGVVTFDGPDDSAEQDRGLLGPGEWRNPPGLPRLGEGHRATVTHRVAAERADRHARLFLRSLLGENADFSNLAYADAVVDVSGGGIWPPLQLPSNTIDFNGDGEVFDPLPARPVVVYYQFLEETMTDLEWDDGEDLVNQIGLRTQDTDMDMAITLADDTDDTDGIADNWPANPAFVNVSVIPPFEDEDDIDLLTWLAASGFPGRWGDARPIFLHPDSEAAWRLAQALYFDTTDPDDFQESWDSSQVLEEEERQLVLAAMRAIEGVTNIVFIERSDYLGQSPAQNVTLQSLGVNLGYPVNAVGYTLNNDPAIVVDPGGIPNTGTLGNSEIPWYPEDDYPWMLILKGSDPALGEAGPNVTTEVGPSRNPIGAPLIDNIYTDLDGDGFPDTPDSNNDGLPDQLVFSSLGTANIVPMSPMGRSIIDINLDGAITSADSDVDGNGNLPLTFGPRPNFLSDMNFDLTIDSIWDNNADGNAAVVNILGDLVMDFEPDQIADSVFPGSATPSSAPFPFDTIPCSLVGFTQNVFDTEDIGFVVYTLMGQLSILDEQTRPDREEYIRVFEENIDSNNGGLEITQSGVDKYANFIDNFDTTVSAAPWTTAGTPVSGGWAVGMPVAAGDGVAPTEDFAVDEDDLSTMCLLTDPTPGNTLVGETQYISPNIYGPQDGMVKFAFFINSTTPDPMQPGDGLIVQTSKDGGTTWQSLIGFAGISDQWREAEVEIGETRADSQTGLPTFQVRFIARNSDASRVIEMGVDRIRVQNPYDFLSITHGGEFFSSRLPGVAGYETIEVREPNEEFQDRIGQAAGLSQGDRIGLSNLYGVPVLPDGEGPAPDPCRADVNGDGTIDAVDVALFLELFNAGDPRADFADPEGVIDIFDLVQFFTEVQQSFRCLNDPDNNFGLNNFTGLNPPG